MTQQLLNPAKSQSRHYAGGASAFAFPSALATLADRTEEEIEELIREIRKILEGARDSCEFFLRVYCLAFFSSRVIGREGSHNRKLP